jgi:hypothetical protein
MNSNTYRLNNEQLLLVNILNTMYNDNIRHINSISETLNNLVDSNNQIRILLTQIINSNQNLNTNNIRRNRRWDNISERILVNNRPYVIDNINRYNIPRSRRNNDSNELFTQIFNNFLQPVEVYPTQSQIETATRRVRYCDISRPINTSCPISMEEFNDNDMVIVIRQCGHIFHIEQLMNWFRSNCRCPVCRYDIREYNTGSPSDFFNLDSSTNTDSSNNNVERIINQDTFMNRVIDGISTNSQDSLFYIAGLLDTSGNYTNFSNDEITTLLTNVLNRSRNTR